jgi:two-component sensor histidine kinase
MPDLEEPDQVEANRSGRTYRLVVWLTGIYAVASLAVLPIADQSGPEMPAIASITVVGIAIAELSTSFLLLVWFRDAGTWSLLLLACAYLYGGLMAVCHLLSFPGAVLPGHIVIGTSGSASWTFLFWLDGYAALTLASVIVEVCAADGCTTPEQVHRAVAGGVAATLCAVVSGGIVTTLLVDRMPPLLAGSALTGLSWAANGVALTMLGTGVGVIWFTALSRNALFRWVGLTLTSVLITHLLSVVGGARYTIGWSVGRLGWFLSACIIFLFFMQRFAAQQRQLTRARTRLEQRVTARTADLTKTIHQRDQLLREVYHRVTNNLQVVDSLMAMESRRLEDALGKDALGELRNRIFTLGLAHQQLMASDDLETFSIAPFLQQLSAIEAGRLGLRERNVELIVNAECVMVTLDFAIPFGLLTTELMSHAIKRDRITNLTIDFYQSSPEQMALVVQHDGNAVHPLGGDGLGGSLIAGLTRQLDGRIEVTHELGTRIEILIPVLRS